MLLDINERKIHNSINLAHRKLKQIRRIRHTIFDAFRVVRILIRTSFIFPNKTISVLATHYSFDYRRIDTQKLFTNDAASLH